MKTPGPTANIDRSTHQKQLLKQMTLNNQNRAPIQNRRRRDIIEKEDYDDPESDDSDGPSAAERYGVILKRGVGETNFRATDKYKNIALMLKANHAAAGSGGSPLIKDINNRRSLRAKLPNPSDYSTAPRIFNLSNI